MECSAFFVLLFLIWVGLACLLLIKKSSIFDKCKSPVSKNEMNAPQVEGNVNLKSFLLINMVELLINVVELDHWKSAGKTLVNKMGLIQKGYLCYLKLNYCSLHFTVFNQFVEYWICFCASKMSKCMFTFSLETTVSIMFTQCTQRLCTYSRFLSTWGQESCQSINGKTK